MTSNAVSENLEAEVIFYGGDSSSKIKIIDCHPKNSWVAASDERECITLWDFGQQEVLQSFTLPELDGTPSLGIGSICALRWYDVETLWWSCRYTPQEGDLQQLPQFLIIVCEQHAMFVNPLTMEVRHVSSDDLNLKEAKAGLCCVELVSASVVAFGCSDGLIRLWDWTKSAIDKVLRGHKDKTAVTHLLNVHRSSTFEQPDALEGGTQQHMKMLSRGEDGQILLWVASGDTPASPTQLEKKKDEKDCNSISYCPSTNTVTAIIAKRRPGQAADLRLLSWDLDRIRNGVIPLLGRNKMSKSKISPGLTHSPLEHPRFPAGCVVACGKDSHIYFMVGSTSTSSAFDSNDLASSSVDDNAVNPMHVIGSIDVLSLVSGVPSKLKFYVLRTHMMRHNILVCASNVGMFVVSLAPSTANHHCCHFSWGPNSLLSLVKGGVVKSVVSWAEGGARRLLREEIAMGGGGVSPRTRAAELMPSPANFSLSDSKLIADPSGAYVAVISCGLQTYKVYSVVSDAELREVDSGECVDFAWFDSGDGESGTFVIIPSSRLSQGGKVGGVDKDRSGSILMIKRIKSPSSPSSGSVVSSFSAKIDSGNGMPRRLYGGGSALCVSFRPPLGGGGSSGDITLPGVSSAPMEPSTSTPVATASTTASSSSSSYRAVPAESTLAPSRFFTWNEKAGSMTSATDILGAVSCVVWDQTSSRCAYASANSPIVRVYSCTKKTADGDSSSSDGHMTLSASFTLGSSEKSGDNVVESMLWVCGTLFLSTAAGVWAAFCTTHGTVDLMQLASHSAPASPPPALQSMPTGGMQPVPVSRPMGFLEILGLFKGDLLVRNSTGSHLIPLDQPCIRFAMLVCAGQADQAVDWAVNGLRAEEHDLAALFLERHNYLDRALLLPCLTHDIAAVLLRKHGMEDGIVLHQLVGQQSSAPHIDPCHVLPQCHTYAELAQMLEPLAAR